MDRTRFLTCVQQIDSNPEVHEILEQYMNNETMDFLGKCTEILLEHDDPVIAMRICVLLGKIFEIEPVVNEKVKQLWSMVSPPLKEAVERALLRCITHTSVNQVAEKASVLIVALMKISFSLDYFMVLVNLVKTPPVDVGSGAVCCVLTSIKQSLVLKCVKRVELIQSWITLREEILGLGLTVLRSGEVPIEHKIQASGILTAALHVWPIGADVEKYQIIFQAIVANWEIDRDELHGELYQLMLSVFKKGYMRLNDENFSMMCTMTQSEPGTQNMAHAEQCLRFWREVARFEDGIQGDKTRHYVVLKIAPVLMPFLMFLLRVIKLRDEEDVDDVGYVNCMSREAMLTLKFMMKSVQLLPGEERMLFYNAIKEQFDGPAATWEEMFGRLASLLSIVEDPTPQAAEILGSMVTTLMGLVGSEWPRISQVAIEVIGGILRYQHFYSQELEAQMVEHLVNTCMAEGGESLVFMCRALDEFFGKFGKHDYDNSLKDLYEQLSRALIDLMQVGGETGNVASGAFKHLITVCPSSANNQNMEVFTRVIDMVTQTVHQPQCDIQKYLFQSVTQLLFRLNGPPRILTREFVDNIWGLALEVLTTSHLKDWLYDDILDVIGACVIVFPELGTNNIQFLVDMIVGNLTIQNHAKGTVSLVGDLFRSLKSQLDHVAGDVAAVLLQYCDVCIGNPDDLSTVLLNLGDIVLCCSTAVAGYFLSFMDLISTVGSVYDRRTGEDIDEACAGVYESLLYLSGSILNTLMGAPELQANREYHDCLFQLWKQKHITIEKIQCYSNTPAYEQLLCMSVKFVELAITPRWARVYNHLLNNFEIRKTLQYVSSSWSGSRVRESLSQFGKRAKSLLSRIGRI